MKRLAVIQTAFPGDVILSTPVFESLKKAGHYVVAVVRPQAESLIKHNPYIDIIISYDKKGGLLSFIKAVNQLRAAKCDTALIIQGYYKSGLLPVYAGIDRRIGFDKAPAKFLYTDEVYYDRNHHHVKRCLSLCRGLSPTDGLHPKIFISEKERLEAQELLRSHDVKSDDFIVVAPGSIWATKRWTGYKELVGLIKSRMKYDIVLVGSDGDFQLCEDIRGNDKAINLAGKTDLLVSAAIVDKARLAITNDSAPAHMAAAVGTPVVTIFGPTVPEFGYTPYSPKSVIVENKNLHCRPCSSHGPKKCPEKHFRCMNNITPEEVWTGCKTLLNIN